MKSPSPTEWSSIDPYLDRALDLAGEERDTWLAELTTTHPEIAAEVRKLLQRHAKLEAEGFLAQSPRVAAIQPTRTGIKIGAYTLERLLGRGGMGEVWLASRSDGRYEGKCAIKFLDASIASPKLAERFRLEGSLLARLTHPNIARLLDAGTTDEGQPYLALEFVDGERIDRYCDEHSLSIRDRVRLFIAVVAAAAHAHSHLIIHRDLKPSNVLVTKEGTVKLLDFGIAKLLNPDLERTLTRVEDTALTPEYAAPEQLLGEMPTTATDVYQLGMLLYVLLTRRHPLQMNDSGAERMRVALDEIVPLASTIADKPTRKYLQGDLDAILAKALRKTSSERYATAQALQDDIQRYLSNEPVHARRGATLYRARKFVARHRLELGAAFVVVAALIVGSGIAVNQARTSSKERDRALEELRRAEALNDFSGFLLSEATPRGGKPISQADLLAAGEALVNRRYANDPKLRIHLLLALAARYEESQQFDAWSRALQRAYDESRVLDDVGLRAYATCTWAQQFVEQGDFAKAQRFVDEALTTLTNNPDYIEYESGCRIIESIVSRRMSDADRAIAAAERAVAIESVRPGVPERELESYVMLAAALNQASRFADANATFERVDKLMQEQGLNETRGAAILLNNWAATLLDSGQALRALPLAERAVKLARATDSVDGASVTMLNTYALALSYTGDHAAATMAIDEAVAKGRSAGSVNRMIVLLSAGITAATNAQDVNRASRYLAEADRLLKADQSDFSLGVVQAATARIALIKGEDARALDWARRAMSTLETAARSNASLVSIRILLARSLNANGKFAEALATAETALATAMQQKSDLQYTSLVGVTWIEVAIAQRGLGKFTEARASIAHALDHLNASVGPNAEATDRAKRVAADISVAG